MNVHVLKVYRLTNTDDWFDVMEQAPGRDYRTTDMQDAEGMANWYRFDQGKDDVEIVEEYIECPVVDGVVVYPHHVNRGWSGEQDAEALSLQARQSRAAAVVEQSEPEIKQRKADEMVQTDVFDRKLERCGDVASKLMRRLAGLYDWQGMLQELTAPSGLCDLANESLSKAVAEGRISDSWMVFEVGSDGERSTYYIGGRA